MPVDCKPIIYCTVCGQKKHKKGEKCRRVFWWASCTCRWHAWEAFSNRQDAMQRFKRHKHDAEDTFPVVVQEALRNLQQVGLIAEGYTGE